VIIRYLIGLTLIALCQLASAQNIADADKDRQYVTDQLRLSLYKEPNAQTKVLQLLRSGDLLLIDEIRGPYALVTREEQQKTASLFDEIEKLGNSKAIIDTYEKDMDEMVAKIENLEASTREASETITRLKQEIEAVQQPETEAERPQGSADIPLQVESPALVLWHTLRIYWKIITPILLAILLLSFLISKVIIETRIKSRFHGIKIW